MSFRRLVYSSCVPAASSRSGLLGWIGNPTERLYSSERSPTQADLNNIDPFLLGDLDTTLGGLITTGIGGLNTTAIDKTDGSGMGIPYAVSAHAVLHYHNIGNDPHGNSDVGNPHGPADKTVHDGSYYDGSYHSTELFRQHKNVESFSTVDGTSKNSSASSITGGSSVSGANTGPIESVPVDDPSQADGVPVDDPSQPDGVPVDGPSQVDHIPVYDPSVAVLTDRYQPPQAVVTDVRSMDSVDAVGDRIPMQSNDLRELLVNPASDGGVGNEADFHSIGSNMNSHSTSTGGNLSSNSRSLDTQDMDMVLGPLDTGATQTVDGIMNDPQSTSVSSNTLFDTGSNNLLARGGKNIQGLQPHGSFSSCGHQAPGCNERRPGANPSARSRPTMRRCQDNTLMPTGWVQQDGIDTLLKRMEGTFVGKSGLWSAGKTTVGKMLIPQRRRSVDVCHRRICRKDDGIRGVRFVKRSTSLDPPTQKQKGMRDLGRQYRQRRFSIYSLNHRGESYPPSSISHGCIGFAGCYRTGASGSVIMGQHLDGQLHDGPLATDHQGELAQAAGPLSLRRRSSGTIADDECEESNCDPGATGNREDNNLDGGQHSSDADDDQERDHNESYVPFWSELWSVGMGATSLVGDATSVVGNAIYGVSSTVGSTISDLGCATVNGLVVTPYCALFGPNEAPRREDRSRSTVRTSESSQVRASSPNHVRTTSRKRSYADSGSRGRLSSRGRGSDQLREVSGNQALSRSLPDVKLEYTPQGERGDLEEYVRHPELPAEETPRMVEAPPSRHAEDPVVDQTLLETGKSSSGSFRHNMRATRGSMGVNTLLSPRRGDTVRDVIDSRYARMEGELADSETNWDDTMSLGREALIADVELDQTNFHRVVREVEENNRRRRASRHLAGDTSSTSNVDRLLQTPRTARARTERGIPDPYNESTRRHPSMFKRDASPSSMDGIKTYKSCESLTTRATPLHKNETLDAISEQSKRTTVDGASYCTGGATSRETSRGGSTRIPRETGNARVHGGSSQAAHYSCPSEKIDNRSSLCRITFSDLLKDGTPTVKHAQLPMSPSRDTVVTPNGRFKGVQKDAALQCLWRRDGIQVDGALIEDSMDGSISYRNAAKGDMNRYMNRGDSRTPTGTNDEYRTDGDTEAVNDYHGCGEGNSGERDIGNGYSVNEPEAALLREEVLLGTEVRQPRLMESVHEKGYSMYAGAGNFGRRLTPASLRAANDSWWTTQGLNCPEGPPSGDGSEDPGFPSSTPVRLMPDEGNSTPQTANISGCLKGKYVLDKRVSPQTIHYRTDAHPSVHHSFALTSGSPHIDNLQTIAEANAGYVIRSSAPNSGFRRQVSDNTTAIYSEEGTLNDSDSTHSTRRLPSKEIIKERKAWRAIHEELRRRKPPKRPKPYKYMIGGVGWDFMITSDDSSPERNHWYKRTPSSVDATVSRDGVDRGFNFSLLNMLGFYDKGDSREDDGTDDTRDHGAVKDPVSIRSAGSSLDSLDNRANGSSSSRTSAGSSLETIGGSDGTAISSRISFTDFNRASSATLSTLGNSTNTINSSPSMNVPVHAQGGTLYPHGGTHSTHGVSKQNLLIALLFSLFDCSSSRKSTASTSAGTGTSMRSLIDQFILDTPRSHLDVEGFQLDFEHFQTDNGRSETVSHRDVYVCQDRLGKFDDEDGDIVMRERGEPSEEEDPDFGRSFWDDSRAIHDPIVRPVIPDNTRKMASSSTTLSQSDTSLSLFDGHGKPLSHLAKKPASLRSGRHFDSLFKDAERGQSDRPGLTVSLPQGPTASPPQVGKKLGKREDPRTSSRSSTSGNIANSHSPQGSHNATSDESSEESLVRHERSLRWSGKLDLDGGIIPDGEAGVAGSTSNNLLRVRGRFNAPRKDSLPRASLSVSCLPDTIREKPTLWRNANSDSMLCKTVLFAGVSSPSSSNG